MRVGAAAHLFVTMVAVGAAVIGASTLVVVGSIAGIPVTILGAALPDCDHHSSRPYQAIRRWLPRLVAGCLALILVARRGVLFSLYQRVPVPGSAPFWVGICVSFGVMMAFVTTRRAIPVLRPAHRGVTHHPVVGLGMSAVVVALATTVLLSIEVTARPLSLSLTFGSCFAAGFFSHLLADGLLIPDSF
jgi:hypothetical protein